MHFFSVFLITLFPIIGLLPLHISSQDSSPSILKSTEVKNVTKEHSEQDTKTTGLLGRLFNMVQVEKERPFIPVSENCTLPSLRESMIKNIEYQYFCYRIKTDGMVRFDLLRQRVSSITSYSELRHILFPAPTEYKHPFFNCAFDMFFNHFMNRTPYVWLHWIDFDGSRFPFVWWQKVNVTKSGVFPARVSDSGKPVIIMDVIPPVDHASWSWEEGGPKSDPNPSSESSGIAASSDNMTTGEASVTSHASSAFREGPGLMGSLMNSARSAYSIYEQWRGLPRLQVSISLV